VITRNLSKNNFQNLERLHKFLSEFLNVEIALHYIQMLAFSFNCRENINKYFLKIFECRNCPVLLTNVRVFISTKKNSKYRERLRVISVKNNLKKIKFKKSDKIRSIRVITRNLSKIIKKKKLSTNSIKSDQSAELRGICQK